MDTTKKSKIIIALLVIALLASLGVLAYSLYQNYAYRTVLEATAEDDGRLKAMWSFHKGSLKLWQFEPTNHETRFSGHLDGPFEVWLTECPTNMPAAWTFAERIIWDEHNKMMRYMYQHPDRFKGDTTPTNAVHNPTPAP
jgi:hypothetical protein